MGVNDRRDEPMSSWLLRDVPTWETLAAVEILRQHVPQVKVRVIKSSI